MENEIVTLQDFMFYTKSVVYLLIVCILVLIPGYWLFLTGRDQD